MGSRLAACANILTEVGSRYWWQGKLESAKEVMIILKVREDNLSALAKKLSEHHSYATPELIVLAPQAVSRAYLGWVRTEAK